MAKTLLKPAEQNFTILQRLALELAKKGMLLNESWVEEHCSAAQRLFVDNNKLAVAAVLMAATDKWALDYIKQAPVLVVAASSGNDTALISVRDAVCSTARDLFATGPKLRDAMAAFGLPLPLRKLEAQSLCCSSASLDFGPGVWGVLKDLSTIDASTLSQAIPHGAGHQRSWLMALGLWCNQMARRNGSRLLFLEWVVREYCLVNDPTASVTEVVDFAAANRDTFNQRWTFNRAREEALRWHEALARMNQEERFYADYGRGWDDLIDYGDLPNETEIDGYRFVAVRSGADLFSEGRIMHHCVYSYTRSVLQGECWIYSIQKDGKRVATFELSKMPYTSAFLGARVEALYPQQVKGPCNSAVHASVHKAIAKFVKRVNKEEENDSTGESPSAS